MGSESPLSILFFPLMAHGHMIPMVDMAKLFSSRGVHCTIVTTPVNKPFILKSITKVQPPGLQIDVKTIPFPSVEVGLPEGCENLNMIPGPDLFIAFFTAIVMLKEPFEKLLEVHKPDCLVSDMFFPWSNDLASKIGIPRIVFHGTSYFALCAGEVLHLHKPYLSVESDDEPFVLPGFPDEIKLTRSQLPLDIMQNKESVLTQLLDQCREEDAKSYGVLVNSFHELEPRYADHYKNVLGHRAWEIGPLSLCNMNVEEKGMRGKDASIGENECLKWLDSKRPESVVYVCFGSTCKFSDDQLAEIASGLEESGHNFIWVIRRLSDSDEEDFLPKGFEERVNDKALLIRGWAPQMLILDHPSVGGFVSHCGWNSTLEGISAGLPIVTWPVFAEQFYNEKLVTEVLKIGVSVGARKWGRFDGGNVGKGAIEKAVREVMEGEERRGRARELAKMAKRAVEKDGSSYISLDKLLQELRSKKA